jgi:hypothetical protein
MPDLQVDHANLHKLHMIELGSLKHCLIFSDWATVQVSKVEQG